MNPLIPKPPTSTEIMTLPFLAVITIVLFQYTVYTTLKRRGYGTSCHEILRFEMAMLKSIIIDTTRMILLFLVVSLPLLAITWSTELSVIFIFDQILTSIRSFPLLFFEIAYLFVFLYAIMLFIYYFFTRYGSIYKLPFLTLVRKDIRQYFSKHPDILIIVYAGSVSYATVILVLLTDLVTSPSPLSKGIIGIVVAVLLIEVLRNKKYENAFRLIEKIFKKKKV
jgi:signal transduction histidine kinase